MVLCFLDVLVLFFSRYEIFFVSIRILYSSRAFTVSSMIATALSQSSSVTISGGIRRMMCAPMAAGSADGGQGTMFDFYAADGIIKLYADQQSLMSDFFDMRQFC